jgi:hypothetical protein
MAPSIFVCLTCRGFFLLGTRQPALPGIIVGTHCYATVGTEVIAGIHCYNSGNKGNLLGHIVTVGTENIVLTITSGQIVATMTLNAIVAFVFYLRPQ